MDRIFPNGVLGAESAVQRDWSAAALRFIKTGVDGEIRQTISPENAWRSSVWVRRGVSSIARSVAGLDYRLYHRVSTRRSEVHVHHALDFLIKPNEWQSSNDLIQMTCVLLQLYGECFWLLDRTGPRVTRAWIIHPNAVTEVLEPSKMGLLAWRVNMPDGTPVLVDPLDLAHFRLPDPSRPWRGSSPLESAQIAIDSDVSAEKFNLRTFARGGVPLGVLATDLDVQPDRGKKIAEEFEERHRNNDRIAVLSNGLKWLQVSQNSVDMGFTASQEHSMKKIAAALGVPPVVLGHEAANYATAREQRRLFWTDTIIPCAKVVAGTIDKYIVGDRFLVGEFNTDSVQELRDELPARLDSATKLMALGYPINMINKRLDLGMDDVAWGDTGLLPLGLAPAEVVVADEPPSFTEEPAPQPPPKDEDGGDPQGGEADDQEPEDEESDEDTDKTESKKDREEGRSVGLAVSVRSASDDLVSRLFRTLELSSREWEPLHRKHLLRAIQFGGDQMMSQIGGGSSLLLRSSLVEKFMEAKMVNVVGVSDTTKKWLKQTILEGIKNSETNAQIGDRIRELYNFTSERADAIARNEVASATNGGRFMALQQEGYESHEWLSSQDDRVRDSHMAEDGKVVVVGQPFPTTNLVFPGDPAGDIDETIGCRCITLPAEMARKFTPEHRAAYWRMTVKEWLANERAYRSRIKRHFYAERSALLKELAK